MLEEAQLRPSEQDKINEGKRISSYQSCKADKGQRVIKLKTKKSLKRVGPLYRPTDRDKEIEIMKDIIIFHLLWSELEKLKPDENGNITFNFEQFKRIYPFPKKFLDSS